MHLNKMRPHSLLTFFSVVSLLMYMITLQQSTWGAYLSSFNLAYYMLIKHFAFNTSKRNAILMNAFKTPLQLNSFVTYEIWWTSMYVSHFMIPVFIHKRLRALIKSLRLRFKCIIYYQYHSRKKSLSLLNVRTHELDYNYID